MTEHEATPEIGTERRATDGGPSDGSETPPSVRIVETVAAETGRDAIDLPPLQKYVDSDAIDALLDSGGNPNSSLLLEFSYADVHVTVRGDGSVEVEP